MQLGGKRKLSKSDDAQMELDLNFQEEDGDEDLDLVEDPMMAVEGDGAAPSSSASSSKGKSKDKARPSYPKAKKAKLSASAGKEEMRKVAVPGHRYTPLKDQWLKIYTPLVEHLGLQVRFNLKTRNVELKTCKDTKEEGNLQRGADFVKAFVLGFAVEDALALLRLDDLFLESFDVQDVKPLKGDHLSRAIGRVAGKGGRTKFTIENVSKTRIVLADSKIHILGSYQNIAVARRALCNLILGSPPSKVYGNLRAYASRTSERF